MPYVSIKNIYTCILCSGELNVPTGWQTTEHPSPIITSRSLKDFHNSMVAGTPKLPLHIVSAKPHSMLWPGKSCRSRTDSIPTMTADPITGPCSQSWVQGRVFPMVSVLVLPSCPIAAFWTLFANEQSRKKRAERTTNMCFHPSGISTILVLL